VLVSVLPTVTSGLPIKLSFAFPWLKLLVTPLDRNIYITEFFAPDVLFKTTNDGAPKNTEVIQTGDLLICSKNE